MAKGSENLVKVAAELACLPNAEKAVKIIESVVELDAIYSAYQEVVAIDGTVERIAGSTAFEKMCAALDKMRKGLEE